jgi:hypothetical protein
MLRLDPCPGLIRAVIGAAATVSVAALNLEWLGAVASAMLAKGP